jgi:hypothetical protein
MPERDHWPELVRGRDAFDMCGSNAQWETTMNRRPELHRHGARGAVSLGAELERIIDSNMDGLPGSTAGDLTPTGPRSAAG